MKKSNSPSLLEVRKVKVVNTRDHDVVLRDCYGREHVLFPMKEKEVMMLAHTESKHDSR